MERLSLTMQNKKTGFFNCIKNWERNRQDHDAKILPLWKTFQNLSEIIQGYSRN